MTRYKTHIISQGETIQSIAQLEIGDINSWRDIVVQNDLQYPYIVDTTAEKLTNIEHLVTWGDKLIIPIVTSLLNDIDPNKLSKKDQEFILSVALGRDLNTLANPKELNKYGTSDELVALSDNLKGDVDTVYGVDNVKQSTIMRLSTARGSLLLHAEYGSDLHLLFKKATYEQMQVISIEIIRTVLSDTRITTCTLNTQYIKDNKYYGEYTVTIQDLDASFKLFIEGDNSGNIILT